MMKKSQQVDIESKNSDKIFAKKKFFVNVRYILCHPHLSERKDDLINKVGWKIIAITQIAGPILIKYLSHHPPPGIL